ncbi:single-stranded DNA-binding protein [Kocuria koreensis]|uniref:Single-stranded DNA-binding protein n=1 Tax=Rothia koreensis TaxID=592378 RepID=A0A7K1LI26_9MICC|nr:single-stranded DNA-binding protein [Rothia koreensis]MUN54760.1 single-stranded DNA-binding protein [Rothia koreensis]
MANETTITVVGNLTAAPDLRFTPNGAAVANFTIASTPRKFDKQANEFKEQEALFLRCSVWRETAENVAESLDKGMRVIATGELRQRSFEDKEGNRRSSIELDVQEIGPALKFATAQVTRNQRSQGGQGSTQNAPQGQGWGNAQNQPQRPVQGQPVDPWSGGKQQAADWGNGQDDANVPF